MQRPFSLKELKHGEQATIGPKEHRAKAVQLEGSRSWRASNNQAVEEKLIITVKR
jgi:hypothetical protein